ncbi:hypothetical protein POM88_029980 [Heracleum sosnowskyi]|uniref:Uncharacterized protein n=1 Tax=Heracleum sosnowskyi TaxID=360622 RepID=A0AAD8MI96_9APIA|nr:hypothetical protein POM88_029980 [Heracleum sosnowskyi]
MSLQTFYVSILRTFTSSFHVPPDSSSVRDYDIALQLPELKKMLQYDMALQLPELKKILVSNDVLDLVGQNARLLYAGKTVGYHSRTQEIHELLLSFCEVGLSFAEVGAIVVDLKGEIHLVFGRGGEEMDSLQQQGIHIKVIPGICCFRNSGRAFHIVYAKIKDLADSISTAQLVSPSLIIIGKVVALSPSWPYSSKDAFNLVETR